MKTINSFIFLVLFSMSVFAQQTITKTIMHDGIARSYIIYIPAMCTGTVPVPLLFNFHGRSMSAEEEMIGTNFMPIADTADFILVHPQGTIFEGYSSWNVGGAGFTLGMTVDDVGFTEAMIDTISSQYSIDLTRVYAVGLSNGGFFCFELACQIGNKIAAIGSVAGSMTPETYNNCHPQHPMPVLQIHGTGDAIVNYYGMTWSEPIVTALSYWTTYDSTVSSPVITDMPNINTTDGSTVVHYVYQSGHHCSSVEHYKVISGGHDWPGVSGNMDINATSILWNFVSQYDINGKIGYSAGTNELINEFNMFEVFPNPTSGHFTIFLPSTNGELIITNLLGQQIIKTKPTQKTVNLHLDNNGIYIVYMITKQGTATRKIIVN